MSANRFNFACFSIDRYRIFGVFDVYRIDIPSARILSLITVGIGKEILIPASAKDPSAAPGRGVFHAVNKICQRMGMLMQRRTDKRVSVAEHVHVTVDEARADECAVQINAFIRLAGKRFLVASGKQKTAVLHNKGLLKRQLAGIDLGIRVKCSHMYIPPQR